MAEYRVSSSPVHPALVALLAATFALCPLSPSRAAMAPYRVDLVLQSEYGHIPFTYQVDLDHRAFEELRFRRDELLRKWLHEAQVVLARKKGYRDDVHGGDIASYVTVRQWFYRVVDQRSRRVIEHGEKGVRERLSERERRGENRL